MFQVGGLTINDGDGDAYTDPDPAEEQAEASSFTVGGQPANLNGYFNANNAAVINLTPNTMKAGAVFSLASASIAAAFGIPGKVVAAAIVGGELYALYSGVMQLSASQDPYDPNYHSLYVPINPAIPTLPAGPAGLSADALSFMQAGAGLHLMRTHSMLLKTVCFRQFKLAICQAFSYRTHSSTSFLFC